MSTPPARLVRYGTLYLYLPHTMQSRVYVTIGRSSVCLCVPSIDSSSGSRWVCCWAPCGQEISIASALPAPCAGAQQQMRVASCWQPTKEAQYRLVEISVIFWKRCTMEILLRHFTNRKWYMLYIIMMTAMTLSPWVTFRVIHLLHAFRAVDKISMALHLYGPAAIAKLLLFFLVFVQFARWLAVSFWRTLMCILFHWGWLSKTGFRRIKLKATWKHGNSLCVLYYSHTHSLNSKWAA